MSIINPLIASAPYFLGPLVITGSTGLPLEHYLYLQVVLLCLFGVWALLRRRIRKDSKRLLPQIISQIYEKRVNKKLREAFDLIWILFLFGCAAAFIHLIQSKSNEAFLYCVLFALSLLALSDAFARRARNKLATLLFLLAQTAIGYLSVLTYTGAWLWQPISLCIGLAGMLTSVKLAETLLQAKNQLSLAKGLRASLVLSPVVATFPVYFGVLPSNYLILLVVLPLYQQFLPELHTENLAQTELQGIERYAKQCTLLFVLLLVILRSW